VLEKLGKLAAWPPADPRCTLARDPGQEYYVYVPRNFDPKQTYWIFAAIHGANGNGAGAVGFAGFANALNCIVVAPTYKSRHISPSSGSGTILKHIIEEVGTKCKVHPKVFLTGMSMGAGFSYLFTYANPELVVGCAVHSLGGRGSPNRKARKVPWLVACGEDDEYLPLAKTLARSLEAAKVDYLKVVWFPGVGHTMCAQAYKLTKEHYWRSTTGLTAEERGQLEDGLITADRHINEKDYSQAFKILRKIAGIKQDCTYKQRAIAGIEEIKKTGLERLAEIEEQSRTDAVAALAAIKETQEQFEGTPLAKAVERSRTLIMGRSQVADALQKQKNAEKAKRLCEAAEILMEKNDYTSALAKLRAAAAFPDTPYGQKSAEKIKEIEADPSAMNAEAEAQCRKWLALARNYLANKMTSRARQYLQRIIDTYPDRDEADTAREMLKEME